MLPLPRPQLPLLSCNPLHPAEARGQRGVFRHQIIQRCPRPRRARGSDSDSDNSSGALVAAPGGPSLLDSVLLATWEGAAEAGLFRYDVTACPSKVCARLASRATH